MSLPAIPRRMLVYGSIGTVALVLALAGHSPDEVDAAAGRSPGRHPTKRGDSPSLSADAAAFLTQLAHRATDSTAAAALFASRSWYVAPPPPPPPPPPGPPPPPTAPPLPFTFIGSFAAQGDRVTYFLARGDRIYDVKMGDAVDADYTLVGVDGMSMIFNYKPLNAQQNLAFGATP